MHTVPLGEGGGGGGGVSTPYTQGYTESLFREVT